MRPGALVLVFLLASACSDGGGDASGSGLPGQRDGTERWIVYFADEGPDLAEYRKAIAARSGVDAAEAKLRADALERRREFAKSLKELEGTIVEHWFLTNAVTVEVPSGNVGSLKHMAGIAKTAPDRLIE